MQKFFLEVMVPALVIIWIAIGSLVAVVIILTWLVQAIPQICP